MCVGGELSLGGGAAELGSGGLAPGQQPFSFALGTNSCSFHLTEDSNKVPLKVGWFPDQNLNLPLDHQTSAACPAQFCVARFVHRSSLFIHECTQNLCESNRSAFLFWKLSRKVCTGLMVFSHSVNSFCLVTCTNLR